MKKEFVIGFIIIFIIIILDIIFKNYTLRVFNSLNKSFDDLNTNISLIDDSKNIKALENIKEINNIWEKNFNKLSCFLEHDELEKIKTQIVIIESAIKVNDYECAFEEVSQAKYLLDHLKDKQSFKIENIL